MKYLILILFINPFLSQAKTLYPKNFSNKKHAEIKEILNNIFYEELYKRVKDLKISAPKNVDNKTSINEGRRGKMIIEKLQQKNRERLAKLRGFDPDKVKTGEDLVKLQKQDNKDVLEKMAKMNWENLAKNEIEEIKKKVLIEHDQWRKKHLATLKKWDESKLDFLNEVENYKKTLIEMPLVLPVKKEELNKKVEIEIDREFFIVENSLAPIVKDQKNRPTCSSFAGIRSLEILLAQNNNNLDLSEQYFYWSSKPDCREMRCDKKGSWAGYGFTFSKNSNSLDIPLEANCPYVESSLDKNETQIPLNKTCSNGAVKVNKFSMQQNLDDVINALKNGRSVIASVKLTPNFYNTKGLILDKESSDGGKLDQHSTGHSILIIGMMKLPIALDEGKVCFIMTNSWGQGWGYGGHACISEKWLLNNRIPNPFISVMSLEN